MKTVYIITLIYEYSEWVPNLSVRSTLELAKKYCNEHRKLEKRDPITWTENKDGSFSGQPGKQGEYPTYYLEPMPFE